MTQHHSATVTVRRIVFEGRNFLLVPTDVKGDTELQVKQLSPPAPLLHPAPSQASVSRETPPLGPAKPPAAPPSGPSIVEMLEQLRQKEHLNEHLQERIQELSKRIDSQQALLCNNNETIQGLMRQLKESEEKNIQLTLEVGTLKRELEEANKRITELSSPRISESHMYEAGNARVIHPSPMGGVSPNAGGAMTTMSSTTSTRVHVIASSTGIRDGRSTQSRRAHSQPLRASSADGRRVSPSRQPTTTTTMTKPRKPISPPTAATRTSSNPPSNTTGGGGGGGAVPGFLQGTAASTSRRLATMSPRAGGVSSARSSTGGQTPIASTGAGVSPWTPSPDGRLSARSKKYQDVQARVVSRQTRVRQQTHLGIPQPSPDDVIVAPYQQRPVSPLTTTEMTVTLEPQPLVSESTGRPKARVIDLTAVEVPVAADASATTKPTASAVGHRITSAGGDDHVDNPEIVVNVD